MSRISASEAARRRWGEPLGPPPKRLTAAERRAWHEIVERAPPLRRCDEIWLRTTATLIADWRGGQRDVPFLREAYRWLANGRVPMRGRRELLFPDRPRRT